MSPSSSPSPSRALLAIGLLLAGCSACGNKAPPPAPAAEPDQVQAPTDQAPAQQAAGDAPFHAHMLVGESPKALHSWTMASDEVRASGEGMLEQVVFGQRIFVRVAVTGFEGGEDFELTGAMKLLAPDGRLLHEQPVAATQADQDTESPGVLVLLPGMDIVFDPGDATGAYHLEGSVLSGDTTLSVHSELRVADQGLQLDPAMEL
jgi:hypothetical protein